jgi:hypothetical protein
MAPGVLLRMPKRSLLLLSLFAASVAAQNPAPKAVARGTVVAAAGAPLPGAEVFSDEIAGLMARSDSAGRFMLSQVPAGTWSFIARLPGFLPETLDVSLAEGDTATFKFVLQRDAVTTLASVEVKEAPKAAMLDAFERRLAKKGGGAHFVTQREIEQQQPRTIADIVRRVMGVRIMDSLGVPMAVSARGNKVVTRRTGDENTNVACVLRTGIDGNIQDPMLGVNVADPREVYAVEVYTGPATIPPEFSGGSRNTWCGLIMVWTKRR